MTRGSSRRGSRGCGSGATRSLRSRRRSSSASTTAAGGRSRVRPRSSRSASASASARRAKAWPAFSPRSTRRWRTRAKRARCCCALTSPARRWTKRSSASARPPCRPTSPLAALVTESDRADYQTMFAAKPGAVAAPTAGLHFTPALVARLAEHGVALHRVTLHVGAGTFAPVRVEDTRDHKMHSEWGSIDAATAEALNAVRERGGRVVCVGTTSARIVESAADENGRLRPFSGETDIFISPGYRFRCRRRAHDQLSFAAIDAVHARLGLQRA